MQKNRTKSPEPILSKQVVGIKAKRVNKIKDARRLLAKLIYEFQMGKVSSEYLKTLCYALIKYSELFKVETLESINERISDLEEKYNGKT